MTTSVEETPRQRAQTHEEIIQEKLKDAGLPEECCRPNHLLCYKCCVKTTRWRYLADPYIRRGYRVTKNPKDVIASLFELHNETVNVWLHLLGGIWFLALLVWWGFAAEGALHTGFGAASDLLFASAAKHLYLEPISSSASQISGIGFSPNPASFQLLFQSPVVEPLLCAWDLGQAAQESGWIAALVTERLSTVVSLSVLVERISAQVQMMDAPLTLQVEEAMRRGTESLSEIKAMLYVYMHSVSDQHSAASFKNGSTEVCQVESTESVFLNEHAPLEAMKNGHEEMYGEWGVLSRKLAANFESLANAVRMVGGHEADDVAAELGRSLGPDAQQKQSSSKSNNSKGKDSELSSLSDMAAFLARHLGVSLPSLDEDVPLWPLLAYMFGAFVCLAASALYHLGMSMDCHANHQLCKVDMAGISFMISASFLPPVYYSFYCNATQVAWYLGVPLVLSVCTLIFCVLPQRIMEKAFMRNARVGAYLATGLFAFVPFLHIGFEWGFSSDQMNLFSADGNMWIVALLYATGVFLYASRFPECMFEGRFDYFFASHQMWHLCVLGAAVAHYHSAVKQYQWRRLNATCGLTQPLWLLT